MNSSHLVRRLMLPSIIASLMMTSSALQAQVVRQMTDIKTGCSSVPAIDSNGVDVYVSSTTNQLGTNASHAFQLVRFTASSGAGAQLTTATDGISNDRFVVSVSSDDQWVAFVSRDNPTGQNPDRSGEVFVVAHDGTGLQQITNHHVATGIIERVDGLGFRAPYNSPVEDETGINIPSVDDTGVRAVVAESVNNTRGNPDFFKEVFLYDYTKAPAITVSSGPAPTRVSWDVETGPVRYDMVRGDTANLSINGSSLNLGTVQCVKNDSPVNSTESSDDGLTPAPGHVFFYVYRGSQGLSAGPGSYGQGTGAKERLASGGDCAQ